MRIPGVLQRIAVCYLIVSLIYLHTSWRQQDLDRIRDRRVGEAEERYRRHDQAEREDQQRAREDLIVNVTRDAGRDPLGKSNGYCDTDDEKEEGEDVISRRNAVPLGVLQRPIDRRPRTRIVDEHHPRDRHPAEDVEGYKPLLICSGHLSTRAEMQKEHETPKTPFREVSRISRAIPYQPFRSRVPVICAV